MVRFLGILVLVLDVVFVLDIYRGNMDTERKVLWILIVFFLPLLGPLLYYVVAKSR